MANHISVNPCSLWPQCRFQEPVFLAFIWVCWMLMELIYALVLSQWATLCSQMCKAWRETIFLWISKRFQHLTQAILSPTWQQCSVLSSVCPSSSLSHLGSGSSRWRQRILRALLVGWGALSIYVLTIQAYKSLLLRNTMEFFLISQYLV